MGGASSQGISIARLLSRRSIRLSMSQGDAKALARRDDYPHRVGSLSPHGISRQR
jgi:hypothetical protein